MELRADLMDRGTKSYDVYDTLNYNAEICDETRMQTSWCTSISISLPETAGHKKRKMIIYTSPAYVVACLVVLSLCE